MFHPDTHSPENEQLAARPSKTKVGRHYTFPIEFASFFRDMLIFGGGGIHRGCAILAHIISLQHRAEATAPLQPWLKIKLLWRHNEQVGLLFVELPMILLFAQLTCTLWCRLRHILYTCTCALQRLKSRWFWVRKSSLGFERWRFLVWFWVCTSTMPNGSFFDPYDGLNSFKIPMDFTWRIGPWLQEMPHPSTSNHPTLTFWDASSNRLPLP